VGHFQGCKNWLRPVETGFYWSWIFWNGKRPKTGPWLWSESVLIISGLDRLWSSPVSVFFQSCNWTFKHYSEVSYNKSRSRKHSASNLKCVIFAMGWKGQMWADLEQAKTHKHQHQINTNLKNTNNTFYSVRGRLLGYAQNRSHRDFKSKVCNCLIELQ